MAKTRWCYYCGRRKATLSCIEFNRWICYICKLTYDLKETYVPIEKRKG